MPQKHPTLLAPPVSQNSNPNVARDKGMIPEGIAKTSVNGAGHTEEPKFETFLKKTNFVNARESWAYTIC